MLKRQFEKSIRKRTGREIDKATFLEMFKGDKEAIRKAKFFMIRTRDEKSGRMVLREVTRVYDQPTGVMLFEDQEGTSFERQDLMDDGELEIAEGQMDRVMDDLGEASFQEDRGGALRLRAEDLGLAESQSLTPKKERPVASPSSAERKPKDALPDLASSSDEEAPFQRSLKSAVAAEKDKTADRKASAKGKAKASSAQQGGGSAVAASKKVGGGSGTSKLHGGFCYWLICLI